MKQFVYGIAYLALAALIVFGIYGIWFRKAPASAPCASCTVESLRVTASSTALQAGQDQSVILATFENDSSDQGVNFSYNVTVYDVLGNQIDAFTGTSSILPAGSRYLVLTGIVDNPDDVGLTDIETNNITPMPPTQIAQYEDLSINKSSITTDIDQNGGYVGGTISNNAASKLADVQLSAIIYDIFGNIIGASGADTGSVVASSTEPFKISFPTMDIRTANSIDKTKTEVFYEITEN